MAEISLIAKDINVNYYPLTSPNNKRFSLVSKDQLTECFSDQINIFIDDIKDECIDIDAFIKIAMSHFGNELIQAISKEINPESIYSEDELVEYSKSVGYYHPSEQGGFTL